jgi:hypothetical protein
VRSLNEHLLRELLERHAVETTRIGGGAGGATVPVSELLHAVTGRVGESDGLEAKLDQLVKRVGGQRTNFADTAGYMWRLRRLFGQSSKRPEDVYVLPTSLVPPPYDRPY